MENEKRIASIAVIGSEYEARVSVFTTAGSGVQTILNPDRRRFSVRFSPGPTSSSMPMVYPATGFTGVPQAATYTGFIDYFFAQWPGIVTGGFIINPSLGSTVCIVEQLFLGRD